MSSKDQYSTEVIPLICLDVDGTLVGESGIVSDAVWAACDDAIARGQHLALCTARGAFGSSWDMANRLDPTGWHVFHAGGAVVHATTATVRSYPIAPAIVEATLSIALENNWIIEFYTATDYVVESSAPLAVDHAALLGVAHISRPLAAIDQPNDGIVRVQFIVPETSVPLVRAATVELGLNVTAATSPIMPGVAFVSLTCAGVTKASGVELIAGELGLPLTDVMMVGDGDNDLPAIAAVGHPVAMANAVDDVLELATYVVGDVSQDGVVDALELSARL